MRLKKSKYNKTYRKFPKLVDSIYIYKKYSVKYRKHKTR